MFAQSCQRLNIRLQRPLEAAAAAAIIVIVAPRYVLLLCLGELARGALHLRTRVLQKTRK